MTCPSQPVAAATATPVTPPRPVWSSTSPSMATVTPGPGTATIGSGCPPHRRLHPAQCSGRVHPRRIVPHGRHRRSDARRRRRRRRSSLWPDVRRPDLAAGRDRRRPNGHRRRRDQLGSLLGVPGWRRRQLRHRDQFHLQHVSHLSVDPRLPDLAMGGRRRRGSRLVGLGAERTGPALVQPPAGNRPRGRIAEGAGGRGVDGPVRAASTRRWPSSIQRHRFATLGPHDRNGCLRPRHVCRRWMRILQPGRLSSTEPGRRRRPDAPAEPGQVRLLRRPARRRRRRAP